MHPNVSVALVRPASESLIPDPTVVRSRLYRLRAETRLLARLLRLSEDHLRTLPHTPDQTGRVQEVPHVA